jgi:hypothetical protein
MKSLLTLLVLTLFATPFVGGFGLAFAVILAIGFFTPKMSGVAYMAVPIQDAQSLFTKTLIAVYKEMPVVTGFLRSFFEPIESLTKEVSIAVQRGSEKVAVDVYRHSDGNRNTFEKATEKVMIPPLYDEYFTANEHRLYDQVIMALSEGNTALFAQMTQEQAEDLMELQKKIERAIEVQAKQVLESGIVQLKSGDNIDYKRKAGSLVDKGAGNYWTTGTISPYADLEAGCNFIRQKGKAQGAVFNAILGSEALEALLNNPIVQNRADIKSFTLDEVTASVRDSVGASIHGTISCGSYRVRLWSYPEFYDDATGTSVPYIDPKLVILLPENKIGKESYSAVPQLIQDGAIPQKGRFLIADYVDVKKTAHEVHIKSAPLIVPVKIDQIYTVQVIA